MAVPKIVVDLIERFNMLVYDLYTLAESYPLGSCLNPLGRYTWTGMGRSMVISNSGLGSTRTLKTATTGDLWISVVNRCKDLSRWAFIEIANPWDGINVIQTYLKGERQNG